MGPNDLLSTLRLVRPAKPRGACPACATTADQDHPHLEIAPPAVTAFAVLLVAGGAWALTVAQSRSMAAMEMGLGSIQSFASTWIVMMAAMMLPSAVPLVFEFSRISEGRRGWQTATGLLGITYLAVWLAFGAAYYVIYNAIHMPWPNQNLIGGLALLLAALYALTPLNRASQARCRSLSALHGPLPFNIHSGALVAAARYGLSCIGCSAALMAAMVVIGMSNLGFALVVAALVLMYKLGPAAGVRRDLVLSVAVGALGVVYAALAAVH